MAPRAPSDTAHPAVSAPRSPARVARDGRRSRPALLAGVLVASVAMSTLLVACTPRVRAPATPTPTATASPGPTTKPPPDATIPETPEGADSAATACTEDLAAWILGSSALLADDQVPQPVPSDPTVDLTGFGSPACTFTGSDRAFTDIEEVQATSDVRVWLFTDAATAASHADAVVARLEAAGYAVTTRQDGEDSVAHLVRTVGTEVADEGVVLTWGDATAGSLGADPGQVAVAVDIVTFSTVG